MFDFNFSKSQTTKINKCNSPFNIHRKALLTRQYSQKNNTDKKSIRTKSSWKWRAKLTAVRDEKLSVGMEKNG